MKNYLIEEYGINQVINLTRITNIDQAILLHIEDSLVGISSFEEPYEGEYADIGSGCGFPGVVNAIATNIKTTLYDSTEKKMRAVQEILEEIDVANQIAAITTRVEDLGAPQRYKYVSARAMTTLPAVLELATPLLEPEGKIIAYKSGNSADEETAAKEILEILGLEQLETIRKVLSDGETLRVIYQYRRVSEPQIKLPRRNGMAQKHPLQAK